MKRTSYLCTLFITFNLLATGDVFDQLRVAKSEAGREVVESFAYGHVDVARVRGAFRSATPAMRAALVEQVLVWTKAYVASPQFARDYAAKREEAKPQRDERGSIDDELKERREQRRMELEMARQTVAETPKEYRAEAEQSLKAAAAALEEFDSPAFRKAEREQIAADRAGYEQSYKDELANWNEQYPADAKTLVRQRLREFLEETDGVDFNARLAGRRFANPDYESKPGNWKLAYRAGKEPTEKARAFAKSWLAELK